jgi:hypothetical protein
MEVYCSYIGAKEGGRGKKGTRKVQGERDGAKVGPGRKKRGREFERARGEGGREKV